MHQPLFCQLSCNRNSSETEQFRRRLSPDSFGSFDPRRKPASECQKNNLNCIEKRYTLRILITRIN